MKKQDKKEKKITLPTEEVIKAEIKRETYKRRYKRVLRSTVYSLIIVAAIAVLIATLVLPVVQITGISMETTLHEGDIIVLMKTNRLQRGDLCAFSYSNKILIKRVIGVPGDYIDIDGDGNVYVNGVLIDEPYVTNKSLGDSDLEYPYQVPESQYFMMGDQRDTSVDSRNTVIGCITTDQMLGKILFKIWPLDGNFLIE